MLTMCIVRITICTLDQNNIHEGFVSNLQAHVWHTRPMSNREVVWVREANWLVKLENTLNINTKGCSNLGI